MQKNHNDEVFLSKRRPKNPIKFNISLNEEQKSAKEIMLSNPVTVLRGMAGSGKTLVAVQTALDLLFTKQVEKIIITRPTVAKEDIGFLPGDIKEKMDPWLAPIYHNLYLLYSKEKIDKEVEEGNIEILPFAFMRGRTFVNAFVIVDEAQNLTPHEVKTIITRAGEGTKIVFTGDVHQIDTPYLDEYSNGLAYLIDKLKGQPLFAHVKLEKGERSELANLANELL